MLAAPGRMQPRDSSSGTDGPRLRVEVAPTADPYTGGMTRQRRRHRCCCNFPDRQFVRVFYSATLGTGLRGECAYEACVMVSPNQYVLRRPDCAIGRGVSIGHYVRVNVRVGFRFLLPPAPTAFYKRKFHA